MNQILHIDYMHKMSESIMASRNPAYVTEKLRFALEFSGIINFDLAYDSPLCRVRKLNEKNRLIILLKFGIHLESLLKQVG